jgi:pyruvate dehydrogenase E2 component (dihydrolipoamide acetyltransferase)
LAQELGIDWSHLKGSGRTGRIIERDILSVAEERTSQVKVEVGKVSPVARRLAESAGVDLADLVAQYPDRRITKTDVQAAIEATQTVTAEESGVRRLEVDGMRRTIATRMLHSSSSTAAVTLVTHADATELVELREKLKGELATRGRVVPTYTDFFVKICGVALSEHPLLNARWQDDEILLLSDVNIGVAVQTPRGLVVPVVRDVVAKSTNELTEEIHTVVAKARAGELDIAGYEGGTFTVTNLGTYNIDVFTPIINPPESAILGIGRIREVPAVWNGQVVPRKQVGLSLTFDHRVMDGVPAAEFLDTVRGLVEHPYVWIGM